MEPRTLQHIRTAQRNREFARSVANAFAGEAPAYEWAAVIAFYAAVHVVNAYLWEPAGRLEPRSHDDRRRILAGLIELKGLSAEYLRLEEYSRRARYEPDFRVRLVNLQSLLDYDLPLIEAAVTRQLTT